MEDKIVGHTASRRLERLRAGATRGLCVLVVVGVLALGVGFPVDAAADTVDPTLYWVDVVMEANRISHTNGKKEQTGPPLSARAGAIVTLSMYDAFAGTSGNPPELPPYLPNLPRPPQDTSVSAAVAYAAFTTLSTLYPSQKASFEAKLASAELAGTAAEQEAGRSFGISVAQAILADRSGDPGVDDTGYAPSNEPGRHRVDPENPTQGFHGPFFGAAKAFAVTERHALDSPPPLGSKAYRTAFREVRSKGIAPELEGTIPPAGPKRTAEETLQGIFWAYDGAKNIGTPSRLYNAIVRSVAIAQGNTPAENARLFALVNAAMADGAVLGWAEKYRHDRWRPIVGIREDPESDGPGGPADDRDAAWRPLGAPKTNEPGAKNFTPAFPAYPSGHAVIGTAALEVVRLFYGVTGYGPDHLADGLRFVSDELNGVSTDNRGNIHPLVVRTYPDGLWQMIQENARSRVFLGVHWIYDAYASGPGGTMDLTQNVGGVRLGLDVATDIFGGARAAGLAKSSV